MCIYICSVLNISFYNNCCSVESHIFISALFYHSLFCSFHAGLWGSEGGKWLPGLLMEEGIKLLKESAKRPECIVNIRGFVIFTSFSYSHILC